MIFLGCLAMTLFAGGLGYLWMAHDLTNPWNRDALRVGLIAGLAWPLAAILALAMIPGRFLLAALTVRPQLN